MRKKKAYEKIERLRVDILISDFELNLIKIKKTKDKRLLEVLENIYNDLPENLKNKIKREFNKIKEDFENEE